MATEGETVEITADLVSEPKPTVVWEHKQKKDIAKKNRFTYDILFKICITRMVTLLKPNYFN